MQQKTHIQTENKVVLSYAVKWGGGGGGGGAQKTKTFAALEVLTWEIKITAGYCIGILQKQADYQSRTTNIPCNLKSTREARHRSLCIISISQNNELQYMPSDLELFSKGTEELQFSST